MLNPQKNAESAFVGGVDGFQSRAHCLMMEPVRRAFARILRQLFLIFSKSYGSPVGVLRQFSLGSLSRSARQLSARRERMLN